MFDLGFIVSILYMLEQEFVPKLCFLKIELFNFMQQIHLG